MGRVTIPKRERSPSPIYGFTRSRSQSVFKPVSVRVNNRAATRSLTRELEIKSASSSTASSCYTDIDKLDDECYQLVSIKSHIHNLQLQCQADELELGIVSDYTFTHDPEHVLSSTAEGSTSTLGEHETTIESCVTGIGDEAFISAEDHETSAVQHGNQSAGNSRDSNPEPAGISLSHRGDLPSPKNFPNRPPGSQVNFPSRPENHATFVVGGDGNTRVGTSGDRDSEQSAISLLYQSEPIDTELSPVRTPDDLDLVRPAHNNHATSPPRRDATLSVSQAEQSILISGGFGLDQLRRVGGPSATHTAPPGSNQGSAAVEHNPLGDIHVIHGGATPELSVFDESGSVDLPATPASPATMAPTDQVVPPK
jgi:hypothetical protein